MSERFSKIVNNPKFVPITVGVISFGVGVGVGYLFSKKGKRTIHVIPPKAPLDHAALDKFIEDEEKRLGIERKDSKPKVEVVPDVVENFVAKQLEQAMTTHHEPEPEVVKSNIFADDTIPADTWDYEEELKNRDSSKPYILHKDEFYGEEMDFHQITLTYYAGDNIMADEDDTPVYNYEDIVGPLFFGHGSGDPKIVYVRNVERHAEYEIVHDTGLYSVEVLGLEMETNERAENIKHSARKFKMTE